MPGEMAVQLALSGIAGQPRLDEAGAALGIAGFEIAVGAGMGGKGVARIVLQRALDLGGAASDVAKLDPRPAEIGKEPPILAPTRGQPFEQRQLRLVVVEPAAEAEQPQDAERQR